MYRYMKIVVSLMLSFLLISCGGGMDASKFLAERDSILNVNAHQQKELWSKGKVHGLE